MTKTKSS